MSTLLEIKDVSKEYRIPVGGFILRKYKPLHAVDGVSLKIDERACFGIVGETGSGKTTLAKLILMLEKPTGGSISFEAQNLKDFKVTRPSGTAPGPDRIPRCRQFSRPTYEDQRHSDRAAQGPRPEPSRARRRDSRPSRLSGESASATRY